MGFFGGLIKTAVNVVALPVTGTVAVVKDVVAVTDLSSKPVQNVENLAEDILEDLEELFYED